MYVARKENRGVNYSFEGRTGFGILWDFSGFFSGIGIFRSDLPFEHDMRATLYSQNYYHSSKRDRLLEERNVYVSTKVCGIRLWTCDAWEHYLVVIYCTAFQTISDETKIIKNETKNETWVWNLLSFRYITLGGTIRNDVVINPISIVHPKIYIMDSIHVYFCIYTIRIMIFKNWNEKKKEYKL